MRIPVEMAENDEGDALSEGSDQNEEEFDAAEEQAYEEYDEEGEDGKEKVYSPLDIGFPDLLSNLRHTTHDHPMDSIRVQLVYPAIQYDKRRRETIVTLIGRADNGQSVAVFGTHWNARLLIKAPERWAQCKSTAVVNIIMDKLDSIIRTRMSETDEEEKLKLNKMDSLIHSITTVTGRTIMHYSADPDALFLCIHVKSPALIRPLRDCFHGYTKAEKCTSGIQIYMQADKRPGIRAGRTETWESNIEPMMQFMAQNKACGGGWFEVPLDCLSESADGKRSYCDLEGYVNTKDLKWLDPDVHYEMAPLRVLSFDIECAAEKGTFPQAGIKGKTTGDPVIQIAIYLSTLGESDENKRKPILLNLRSCDPIDDVTVICYEDEQENLLLRDFARIVQAFGPDIVTGYNIGLFDFPYICDRADMYDEKDFVEETMSKLRWNRMGITVSFYCSAQTGKQQRNKIRLPGAISFDMIVWMRTTYNNLDSYKLNNVAQKFLDGQGKEDMSHTEITPLFNGTSADRKRLGVYCVQDARLPISLMYKIYALHAAVELARVTSTPVDWVISRGTMSRFYSQLLRDGGEENYFIPCIEQPDQEPFAAGGGRKKAAYKGATVLDMLTGLYEWVITLDFSGMYPAIIIAHNLCFSTYTTDGSIPGSFCIVKGHYFVPAHVRKGVIPRILEKLALKRKTIKAALAVEKDPVKAAALKAKELSVKINMNSIYGALGCSFALLPLMAIAETVTAVGRRDIAKVQEIAEGLFRVENGYISNHIQVVCGDTDSIFISLRDILTDATKEFTLDAVAECIRLANILAGRVNAVMEPPKRIEFEKVWRWILNMCKKHYAGLKYVSHDKPPVIDMKGVECVRRSGCMLVRNLVREVLEKIVHTGAVDEAAAIVRAKILAVINDEVPIEDYAISQVLRKNKQDCSLPLPKDVLKNIRRAIRSHSSDSMLTYPEMEAACRAGLKIPFVQRIRLPHVEVAWKMQQKDADSPVLGETVRSIVTTNGGQKVWEKSEPVSEVLNARFSVDRKHYLDNIKRSTHSIFSVIIQQRLHASSTVKATNMSKLSQKEEDSRINGELHRLLWRNIGDPLRTTEARKRARISASPLMRAFAVQASQSQK